MTTRSLKTILMSGYLSAMLASSVAPLRSDATLASAIDPMSAQKAFQNAVNGIETAGWTPSSTVSAAQAAPAQVLAINNPAPKSDPIMNEELMARLIKYTVSVKETGSLDERVCKVLNLCDGVTAMPLRYAVSDATDGKHYFGIRPNTDLKDIFFVVKRGTTMEVYLTDNTGKLRAAAIQDNGTARLITNESAVDKFKKELSLFAGEASGLPPTGTSVASNG
jgi:hypothetical protein